MGGKHPQGIFLVLTACWLWMHPTDAWVPLRVHRERVHQLRAPRLQRHHRDERGTSTLMMGETENGILPSRRTVLERTVSSLPAAAAAAVCGGGSSTVLVSAFRPTPASASTETTVSIASQQSGASMITMPLFYISSLNAYIVKYTVGGDRFGAIVDTGSPFLTVPHYCRTREYGCYHPERSRPSGLSDTVEIFDGNQGSVEWRRGRFAFVNATGIMTIDDDDMTFGVLSDALLSGSGGVFMGLIRDTDARIRPSFLGQTPVRSFTIDLQSPQKTLTLSTNPLLENARIDYVPLTTDLRVKYGDPVGHYTAQAEYLFVNGTPLVHDDKPIYVIFDTGLTGMAISQDMWNQRYDTARQNREKALWGSVSISFRSHRGRPITMEATQPITTPLPGISWSGFDAYLIVAGLAFLDDRRTVIDIDDNKIWFD